MNFPNYKIFYGIPHCHSCYSTGTEPPTRAFEYARERGLDFLIISDHNSNLKDDTKYKSSKTSKWIASLKAACQFNKKYKDFLALAGFEAKSNGYGHFNIIGSKTFFTGSVNNIDSFMIWLWANPSIVVINHPHDSVENIPINDFLKNYICLIEVGNGNLQGKYFRFEKRYYSMLDLGWKLGAINSQNNHKKDFGNSDNLTAILCTELSPTSLLSALKSRRTYSTESRTLKLMYSINKAFMGEVLNASQGEKLDFNITALDTDNSIEKIEIISSGGTTIKEQSFPPQKKISYIVTLKSCEDEKWYVIKIKQSNNKIAFSSPIFMKIEKSAT